MKETLEIRVKYEYAHLLFEDNEGKNLGTSVKLVEITKEDPRYFIITVIDERLRKEEGSPFYYSWAIKRKYSPVELNDAELFSLLFRTTFEPAGEQRGTMYDETMACEICEANTKQIGTLKLPYSSIPKGKDIARTIAGEIIVSEKFVQSFVERKLKGVEFDPVVFSNGKTGYYQLARAAELELSDNAIGGVDPFDLSTTDGTEIYKCPLGHTMGLNLISELYIINNDSLKNNDLYMSKQKFGIKRGVLIPNSIYVCSAAFRKMVIEEKLTGFGFEVAHVAY